MWCREVPLRFCIFVGAMVDVTVEDVDDDEDDVANNDALQKYSDDQEKKRQEQEAKKAMAEMNGSDATEK